MEILLQIIGEWKNSNFGFEIRILKHSIGILLFDTLAKALITTYFFVLN